MEIPLCQRLLAALISEEGNDELNDDHKYDVYGSGFEFVTDVESNAFNHQSLQNYELGGYNTSNGHRINSTLRPCKESVHSPSDNFDHSYNGLTSDPATTPGTTFSEYQYGNMPINERLLAEIQSIGIYPELVVGAFLSSFPYVLYHSKLILATLLATLSFWLTIIRLMNLLYMVSFQLQYLRTANTFICPG